MELSRLQSVATAARAMRTPAGDSVDVGTPLLADAAAAARPAPLHDSPLRTSSDAVTAAELLARPATALSTEQWRMLGRAIDAGTDPDLALLPAKLPHLAPIRRLVTELADGTRTADAAVQRYVTIWNARRQPAPERADAIATLLQRRAAELTREQWQQLDILLQTFPDGDPALAGLPITLHAVKPFRELVTELANGRARPGANVQRYLSIRDANALPAPERAAAVSALLQRPAADLSRDDWRRLETLLHTFPDEDPALRGVRPIRQIAGDIGYGNGWADSSVQRYFTIWNASRQPATERTDAVTALLRRPATALTVDEWHRLDVLLHSFPDGAPAVDGLPSKLPGAKPIRELAHRISRGRLEVGADVQRYFTTWNHLNDPAFRTQLTTALDAVVTGTATNEQQAVVASATSVREVWTRAVTPLERTRLGAALLTDDALASTRDALGPLHLLRDALPEIPQLPAQLESIRTQTLQLLDRNIAVVERRPTADAAIGYVNHPDYAEIGRIRAYVALLGDARMTPGSPDTSGTLAW